MIDAERIPLPPGLPVHLSNGSEGYEALCKLLGLTNRGERQRLANSLPVKQFLKSSGNAPPPNSKTAERIRHNLIAWFSEPDERRKSWRYFHQRELGDKAVSTRFPCLVRAALSEYDAAFLTSDPDPERLTELKAFYDAKIIDDDWRAPALAALPHLKDDLDRWASLPSERQHGTIAGVFAAATLLDDARLLLWAADQEDDIATRLPFLSEAKTVKEFPDTERREDAAIPSLDELQGMLRERALVLRDAATDLADGRATEEKFYSLQKRYAEVLELREPVLAWADADAVDEQIAKLAAHLQQMAKTVPWLEEEHEPVVSAWEAACRSATELGPEQVRADVDRAIAGLPDALAAVTIAQAGEDAAREERDSHEAAIAVTPPRSRAERQEQIAASNELAAALSKASQAVDDAMDSVLDVLKPCLDGVPPAVSPSDGSANRVPVQPTNDAKGSEEPELNGDNRLTTEELSSQAKSDLPANSSTDGTPDRTDEQSLVESTDEARQSAEREAIPTHVLSESKDAESAGVAAREPKTVSRDMVELSPAQAAVWHAVDVGRIGLAYHIARLDRYIDGHTVIPSPELLAAVAFGAVLQGPHDDIAAAFGQRVGVLGGLDSDGVQPVERDALNLLLFAATVRPAVFAAQHGASIPLLRRVQLSGELSAVYRLAAAIADQAENLKSVNLDLPTLTALLDEDAWKDRMDEHRQAVTKWWKGAGSAKLLFVGAGVVWQQWLGRRSVLGELGSLLKTNRPAGVQRVREILDQLGDQRAVHELIEATYRDASGRRDKIEGRARNQLENNLQAPKQLARDWLRIMEARPGSKGFLEGAVTNLRNAVDEHAPAAMDAIHRMRETEPALPLKCALASAARAAESLRNLFQRDVDSEPELRLGPERVLSDDLLRVVELRISSDGSVHDSFAPADALALLIDNDSHVETLADAFDARLDRDDLYGAHLVLKRMEVEDDDEADSCRERLHRAAAENRAILRRRLFELAEQTEQVFFSGYLTETNRAEITARINDLTSRIETDHGVFTASDSVKVIATETIPALDDAVANIRQQLDEFLPRVAAREQALVHEALKARDLALLHEQFDCLKRNQPLVASDAGACSRLRAFLEAAEKIESELNGEAGPAHLALVRAAADRQDILGLNFSGLSPAQAKRSAELLQLWFQIGRKRSPDPDLIAQLFGRLGFTLTSTSVELSGDGVALLRAKPLRTRELCPIHSFGSTAGGHYSLAFNWGTPTRERILQAVDVAARTANLVVMHFGKLLRDDRDWLRRWSIEHAIQFITIDETVVLYLATLGEGQLRALFDCTLPFTSAEPFFTAPGLAPPEAFFGRDQERRDIRDPYGSCFVYGGRQLGKTALLRTVEAAFHDPDQRCLATYIDLKYKDVGIAYDAQHIWQVLWHEYAKLGVVESGAVRPRGSTGFANAVEKCVSGWLNDHDDGRLLLLLDEADAFLAKDLKGAFQVSGRLKGLMDDTQRRFKVVFCGLHDVLRNTERANHPLAHLGTPVCVGPLLENGELNQARRLVRDPLAAVGYEFESDNLVTSILLWTNYYPSLIQLYGEALLAHLRQASGRQVPHVVTADDIQAVFARDRFREKIRSRFSLTLQLDQRYELIAYVMALELQGASLTQAEGLSSNRILKRTRTWWPEGFKIPKREFDTLLDELCGLGVLRRRPTDTGSGRYVFRNPNVLRLLGDADTILDVLGKERQVPELFDESAYHTRYQEEPPRFAPLTYEQEATLKRGGRIAVLCGARAAHLEEVDAFLEEKLERGCLRRLTFCNDASQLVRAINLLRPGTETYVCLVDENEPWTLNWLEKAASALRSAQRGAKFRVVFRADPEQLWRFVADLPVSYLDTYNDLFDWVTAQPWNATFARRWCSDVSLPEVAGKIHELMQLTGGWPLLLDRYRDVEATNWKGKALELDDYINEHRDELLDAVGLGEDAARCELAPLRAMETLKAEDVEACADLWVDHGGSPVDADVLRRRLFWATQLGIVVDVNGEAVLNPLVARILPDDAR